MRAIPAVTVGELDRNLQRGQSEWVWGGLGGPCWGPHSARWGSHGGRNGGGPGW